MAYRIRWEGHGVYRHFYLDVTGEEFLQAKEEMLSDLRYRGIRYILDDYLDVETVPELVESYMERYGRTEKLRDVESPDIVRASVATKESMLKLLRYFADRDLAPYPFAVFATVAEARTWIAKNPRPEWRKNRPQ